MYTAYIMKRTQIYLDESQDERLSRRARAAGTTKSDLIREALDAYLGPDNESTRLLAFRAAVQAAAGAARRLPTGREYVDEIRSADAERARVIEDRRRR
jgi:predicted DNA-binding protein